jgi:steroid 5-alpha reductase family enzyme
VTILDVWFLALLTISIVGLIGWFYSLANNNVAIVDILWSLMFLVATSVYIASVELVTLKGLVVFAMVAIWSTRLSIHIARRSHGKPEDYRYQTIRRNNEPGFKYKSIYIVFGLQGLLAWIISLPLLIAVASNTGWDWIDYLGVSVWMVGMFWEVVADLQLKEFRKDSANSNKVLDTGLWRYSRHPNYFGNACIWWGFYLLATSFDTWWVIVSPLIMTLLLIKVSGVALLESTIQNRRPGYGDYIERTSAFVPAPPKYAAK